jgi:thiol-disulfide isomerase/thioredoxin
LKTIRTVGEICNFVFVPIEEKNSFVINNLKINTMKKYNIIILIITICFSLNNNTFGQGIKFHDGNWASVKERAKKENKLIFVDAFATWCGPCKWMAANVFTNDSVGKFYNSNFINYTIDVEKGEGIAFAKEYSIKAMPTLLFINDKGEVIHRALGSREADKFIWLGQKALDPEKRITAWEKKYKDGNRKPDFLSRYLNELTDAGAETDEIAEAYFKTQKEAELISVENFKMIVNYANNYDNKIFQFFFEKRAEYAKIVPLTEVNDKIFLVFQDAIMRPLYKGDETKFTEVLNKVQNSGFEQTEKLVLSAKAALAQSKQDWKSYVENVIPFVNQFLMDNESMLNNYAWAFYENENITDKEALKNAVTWAKKAVELNDNFANNDTYAAVLYKLGADRDIALKAAEKAIEFAKKEGADYGATVEMREKIKNMK